MSWQSPFAPVFRSPANPIPTVAADLHGLFVGPMPVKNFLDQFLPPRPDPPPTRVAFEQDFNLPTPSNLLDKKTVVQTLANAIRQLLPSWLVAIAPEPDRACDILIDIGVYPKSLVIAQRSDLSRVELFLNVDVDRSSDPFDDSQPIPTTRYYFERENGRALPTKVREGSCVGAMGVLQARTHTFSVLVSGSHARLLRWDAAGVLVTRSFPYTTTSWLIEFLWRFDALSPSQRGLDQTINTVDAAWPTDYAPEDVLTRLKNNQSSTTSNPRHRCFALMKIPHRDTPSIEREFLVSWPPPYTKCSPLGRATRPLLAYDIESRAFVFTKQYWRADDSQKEGEVYRHLVAHNVRRLPVFGMGNDVRQIATVTQTFEPPEERQGWNRNTRPLTKYRLYRMSLNTIGSPLSGFKSTRRLVTAVRDATICHDDAFFRAGILHGDISTNNIMIHPDDGGGFLTDWDSCIDMSLGPSPRRGTWQFMSTKRLRGRYGAHELTDDRESMFWVLLWNFLLHTSHHSPRTLESWLQLFDERVVDGTGTAIGGTSKLDYFYFPPGDSVVESTTSPCLNVIVPKLRHFFALRYSSDVIIDPALPVYQLLVASGRKLNNLEQYEAYTQHMADFSAEGTVVKMLNGFLDDPSLWPTHDDPALPDISLYGKPLSRKRSATAANLDDERQISESPLRPALPVAAPSTSQAPRPSKRRRKLVVPPSDRVLRPRALTVVPADIVDDVRPASTNLKSAGVPPTHKRKQSAKRRATRTRT